MTGDAGSVLTLQLSGMHHYDRFMQSAFHERNNVKSFRTFVTIRTVVDPVALLVES